MKLKRFLITAGALGAGFLASDNANAGSSTNTLSVSANFVGSCSFTTTPLNFPNISDVGGAAVTATATVNLTCPNSTLVVFTADAGGNGTTSPMQRNLIGPSSTLVPYNLYLGPGDSAPWAGSLASLAGATNAGDQTDPNDGSSTVYGLTGTGSAQAFTVYGVLPAALTTPPVGAYSDTVTITAFW
jgi:spore coat protein U-like protein